MPSPKRGSERDLLIEFFFCDETKLNPATSVSVKGGTSGKRRRTSENKRRRRVHHSGASAERQIRSQGPSRQSRQGARLGRVHVHPCCRLQPGRLDPEPQTQDAPRVQQEDESGLWSLHDGLNREARCTGW